MKPDKIDTQNSASFAQGLSALSERETALSKQVRDILMRYPDIEEAETEATIAFLKDGSSLAVGLLGADEEVKQQLHDFRRDHAKHFRPGLLGISVFILAALGPIALLVWAAS